MTTETIRAYMNEAASLQKEINALATSKRALSKRKRELDKLIAGYCRENEYGGVQHRGYVATVEQKHVRDRKKHVKKKEDGEAALRRMGIANPERVLEQVMDAMRGDLRVTDKVSIVANKQ